MHLFWFSLPFSFLLLLLNLVGDDVRGEKIAALVQELDKLHHGILLLHDSQGGPLFSMERNGNLDSDAISHYILIIAVK